MLAFSANKAFAGDDTCSTRAISGVDSCTMLNGAKGICTKTAGDTKPMCYANTITPSGSTSFVNPLAYKSVEELLGGLLGAIQKIIAVLALVFIMIGAVMILTSAGNSGMVEKGKGAITMALVGLALGVAAPSLLKELSNIIGWGGAGNVAAALTLSQIAVNVLNFLLGTMGVVALVMMVIGAIMYLTSAGDEDRIEKGKDIFKYALLGVFFAMASMILVTQIAAFFVSSSNSTTTPTQTTSTTQATIPDNSIALPVDNTTTAPPINNITTETPGICDTEAKQYSNLQGVTGLQCTATPADPSRPGQYTAPSGYDCYWLNVCPTGPRMEACCKAL